MITAIINARSSSERLPSKHLMKIGNKSILEHIIFKLKKIRKIQQIYIASGSKKKNYTYEKFIKGRGLKNIKFFYHNDENNVTGRIYHLSKKIKTDYTILISGDCPLIDIEFINRLIEQLLNNKKFDFIYENKKIIHEGIKLFKTSIWKKVYQLSNKKKYLEHPGYIVKQKPKEFSILKYKPLNYEMNKEYRISVDTESDLEFLNYVFYLLKKKKKEFNLKNFLRIKNLQILNKHVLQRDPIQKKIKVLIITSKDKQVGLGHFKRSLVIKREINERFNSTIDIFNINSNSNFKKLENKLKIFNKKYDLKVIDIHLTFLKKIEKFISNYKKTLIIDKVLDNKKFTYLIPNLYRNTKKIKNIISGEKYIILNRKIIFEKLINPKPKVKIDKLLLIGGTLSLSPEIKNFINSTKKLKIVSGPYVKKKEIGKFENKNCSFIRNPDNIFKIIRSTDKIYSRFGISVFEVLALGKKPTVFFNDNFLDKKIIYNLYVKKFINIYGKKKSKYIKNINIDENLNNLFRIINNIIN